MTSIVPRACLASLFLLSGCIFSESSVSEGGGAVGNNATTGIMTSGTAGTADTAGTAGTAGTTLTGSTGGTCTKVTQCDASQCGMVDDGCGGMLECEPCACKDGKPVSTSCGSCGLGTPTCTGNAFSCEFAAEIVKTTDQAMKCDTIAYVDTLAKPGGDGSAQKPWSTYREAAGSFGEGEKGLILINTQGVVAEVLVVKPGVHVVGGYEKGPSGWTPAKEASGQIKKASVEPPTATDSRDVFGLIAREIRDTTVVYGLQIKTPNAPAGMSAYGAYVVDSDQLLLEHVEIRPGRGGHGADGQDGMKGENGGDGQGATCINRVPKEGDPGQNPACPKANGGRGGPGAGFVNNAAQTYSLAAPGEDSADGVERGGMGGRNNGAPRGQDGQGGMRQSVPGAGGSGGLSQGRVVSSLWEPVQSAKDGMNGTDGSGGGGGGGAGIENTSHPGFGNVPPDKSFQAAAGGGGGAGGCGGQRGTAGKDGGGSFGIFAVKSTISIKASEITAGIGGVGGRGGSGGAGGLGGSGGSGASDNCESYGITETPSGAGGMGGDGSAGGSGGGGAGGVSYGAYCHQSKVSPTETDIQGGTPALGGTGNQEGGAGLSADQFGCF